jgi:hypothetical protein
MVWQESDFLVVSAWAHFVRSLALHTRSCRGNEWVSSPGPCFDEASADGGVGGAWAACRDDRGREKKERLEGGVRLGTQNGGRWDGGSPRAKVSHGERICALDGAQHQRKQQHLIFCIFRVQSLWEDSRAFVLVDFMALEVSSYLIALFAIVRSGGSANE